MKGDISHLAKKNIVTHKNMNTQPWLSAFTQPGQKAFTEGTDDGSKYVQVIKESFAPLHSYSNAVATPFISSLSCACGAKNPDGVCVRGKEMPGAPFWQPNSALTFQMEPYELIPPARQ
jgi:hypothetical protein